MGRRTSCLSGVQKKMPFHVPIEVPLQKSLRVQRQQAKRSEIEIENSYIVSYHIIFCFRMSPCFLKHCAALRADWLVLKTYWLINAQRSSPVFYLKNNFTMNIF